VIGLAVVVVAAATTVTTGVATAAAAATATAIAIRSAATAATTAASIAAALMTAAAAAAASIGVVLGHKDQVVQDEVSALECISWREPYVPPLLSLWCHRVTVMVLQSGGYDVTEYRSWCY
jgi:hypothetical protein